jgi:hypothetical protein
VSTALKVKKALVNAIGQRPEFRNRQVEIAHPGAEAEHELVFIAGVRSADSARRLGKAHRREELTVELGIVCEVLGSDLEETEERAYQMLEGVQAGIYEDTSLGGLVHVAEVVAWDQRSFNGPERSVVEITVDVRVLADFEGDDS